MPEIVNIKWKKEQGLITNSTCSMMTSSSLKSQGHLFHESLRRSISQAFHPPVTHTNVHARTHTHTHTHNVPCTAIPQRRDHARVTIRMGLWEAGWAGFAPWHQFPHTRTLLHVECCLLWLNYISWRAENIEQRISNKLITLSVSAVLVLGMWTDTVIRDSSPRCWCLHRLMKLIPICGADQEACHVFIQSSYQELHSANISMSPCAWPKWIWILVRGVILELWFPSCLWTNQMYDHLILLHTVYTINWWITCSEIRSPPFSNTWVQLLNNLF